MFFGGGGFPGFDDDMGGGGRRGGKAADTTKFYKVLGVDKESSDQEIKKAYRKLAMKHHPDKGGDPDKFKEMTAAFNVLSDPEKRRNYDRFGEDGVDGGGPSGDDLISQMFGGGGGRRQRGPKKGESVTRPLPVTLENLYNGATKKLKIQRQTIDREQGVKKCGECGGSGVVVRTIRMGPMIQQMQQPCSACGGQGFSFTLKRDTEILEVNIAKGAKDGSKVVFHNKADEIPDGEAGDVVFILKEKPHDVYKRHGADLYIEKKISLYEALCGFTMQLEKLDGRTLVVKTPAGFVTKVSKFDPFSEEADQAWETLEGYDCDLDDMAQADSADLDMLKKAVTKGQLKGKGIGCFVVQNGRTCFKQGTRAECMAAKSKSSGSTMYVLGDENEAAAGRMMVAVEGEGLPLARDPFQFGNLFILLDIEFPEELTEEQQNALRSVLPGALNSSTADQTAENVDTCEVSMMDPVASYKDGIYTTKDNLDDDDDEMGGAGGQRVQCAQQ
jgi:DnaJ family protein A protein 2